jgi:hypothetical protein
MTSDPIILVGMQRSGTTWMGRLLGEQPEIAYWIEPRQVWSFGHWFRADDRLEASDATPLVARHVRRRFFEYARHRSKPRFCEKTPSNCLRLPFVRAVFPEARILLIIRDGRSVIRSSNEMRESGPNWTRIRDRVRESSPWDWPSFASRLPWLVDKVRGRPVKFWGVRPPGWKDWAESDPPFVAMAKQWSAAIRYAVTDGQAMSRDRFLAIRYEELTSKPREIMEQVVDFLQLAGASRMVEQVVADADPSRQDKWRSELGGEILEQVRPHLEPTLQWLGYEW